EASSEDYVNRLVRDLLWATQTMLDMHRQDVAEALGHPLAPSASTSGLAHEIAASNRASMDDAQKHSHWNGLLKRIGELHAADKDKDKHPKMELQNNGTHKSFYQKSC
ncbi:hypothetical protein LPJ57_010987, partial [Coemansia sp. RSA 486]